MTCFDAQVSVRLKREEKELVRRASVARGEDVSDFVRRGMLRELAILGFLAEDDTKALGVKP